MLTNDQLRETMIASAGEDESINLDDEFATRPFTELGFDSLALLETCANLKRSYGIEVPDELLWEFSTPEELVRWVNGTES
ncbi:acyl carrier protein [Salinispora mooreana]|uniref:acyl carrier protein n=1 Tax=Salinispora mooreana TaxID=999545 RepID=UPI000361EB87|nr:acyl carrier protein [Salinispora mooreana]